MTKRNQPTDPPTAAAGQICDYIHATTKQCANTHRPYDDRSHDEILSRSPFYPRDAIYSSLFVKKNDSIEKIKKNVTKLQKKTN